MDCNMQNKEKVMVLNLLQAVGEVNIFKGRICHDGVPAMVKRFQSQIGISIRKEYCLLPAHHTLCQVNLDV